MITDELLASLYLTTDLKNVWKFIALSFKPVTIDRNFLSILLLVSLYSQTAQVFHKFCGVCILWSWYTVSLHIATYELSPSRVICSGYISKARVIVPCIRVFMIAQFSKFLLCHELSVKSTKHVYVLSSWLFVWMVFLNTTNMDLLSRMLEAIIYFILRNVHTKNV